MVYHWVVRVVPWYTLFIIQVYVHLRSYLLPYLHTWYNFTVQGRQHGRPIYISGQEIVQFPRKHDVPSFPMSFTVVDRAVDLNKWGWAYFQVIRHNVRLHWQQWTNIGTANGNNNCVLNTYTVESIYITTMAPQTTYCFPSITNNISLTKLTSF